MSPAGASHDGEPASSDSGQPTTAVAADPAEPEESPPADQARTPDEPGRSARRGTGQFFAGIWRRAWVRHVVLLLIFIVAGIGATWPRFAYLSDHKLPRTTDVASFVWGFWWVAHQVTHFGNPFFTRYMAAPVGIQLGFSTLMPLAGWVMTPVTLLWGPSASFTLLSLVTPGLLCYAMYLVKNGLPKWVT
jgi:hypothetical protein